MYFHLQPKRALLNDLNSELIQVYEALKADWKPVLQELTVHQTRHSKDHYYEVRDQAPDCSIQRAARMIYLNRTCFNGIYRVNLAGKFNVPKGTKTAVLLGTDDFGEISKALKGAVLRNLDFEAIVDQAGAGDLVFADPPYTVRHNFNGFVKYNEQLFSWDDQVRLSKALKRASKRGAVVVSTNANHSSVRELYASSDFTLTTVSRFSSISAGAESRSQFEELLIRTR